MADQDSDSTGDSGTSSSPLPPPPRVDSTPATPHTAQQSENLSETQNQPSNVSQARKKTQVAPTQDAEAKRSSSWISDVVGGVSLERQLVDWLVTGRNYDLLKVKDHAEKQRLWERLAAEWHEDGYGKRTAKQVQSKVDELIKKYKQACGFHDHTGQGVKSNEGQLAFTKQLHKICKYYDLFDESLGERSGFRSKKPFGNLGEMEQGWDECLGLKTVRAKKKKREDADEVEEGKQDGDGLVGDAAKAKKRQRLRASATNTSTGPINLLKPTEDPSATPNIPDTSVIEIKDDEEEGEDESREKRPSKSRGKGKGNPVMENLNDFLTTASEERKAQMQLARDMQAKKALRQDEKDKLRKMKEFRSLAPLIGSDVAWEQLFGQPLPSSKMQATQVASTSELAVVEAPKCDEAHQVDIPLDPSLSGNAVLYDPVGDAYHIGSTYGNVIGD